MNCLRPNVKTYEFKKNRKYVNYFGPLSYFMKQYKLSVKKVIAENNRTLMILPCGYCVNCSVNKKYDLRNRCLNDFNKFRYSYFITLTYDNDHNPHVLIKKHIQNFCKYLKKYIKFSYLLAGEYGDHSNRPHFHLVIFTDSLLTQDLKLSNGYFNSFLIDKCWLGRGFNSVKLADSQAVNYLTTYTQKSDQKRQNYWLKKNLLAEVKKFNYESDLSGFAKYIAVDSIIQSFADNLEKYPSFILCSKCLGFVDDISKYRLMCNYELKKIYKQLKFDALDVFKLTDMFHFVHNVRPVYLSTKYITTDKLVNLTVKKKKLSFI